MSTTNNTETIERQLESDNLLLREYLTINKSPVIRFMVLGIEDVGKRSICCRFESDALPRGYDSTEEGHHRRLVSLPFTMEDGTYTPHPVMVEWQRVATHTHVNMPSLWQRLVQESDAFMLVYRVDNRSSCDAIGRLWSDLVLPALGSAQDAPLFLFANATDIARELWTVSQETGPRLASQLGAGFFQLSAKSGEGCNVDVISQMARKTLLHRARKMKL